MNKQTIERRLCLATQSQQALGRLRRQFEQSERARVEAEQRAAELQARVEHLERVRRELDDFACIAAHDLKEPLRGIAAYCGLLIDDHGDRLDHEGKRQLRAIAALCSRAETLSTDLLAYCRIGGIHPDATTIDLGAAVAEVVETLQPFIQQCRGSVRIVDPLPKVTGDAGLISMLFSNVISNGLKFNDNPQPRVQIGCLPKTPPVIYVRDDGIGIEPKHHGEVFDLFRRLHGRRKYEGSGVGLTIVGKIVEAHGGRIWLESQPGEGSTFYFTLAPTPVPMATEPVTRPPHWLQRSGVTSA